MAAKGGECQAVLTREFCVRVLDVSAGGCLVESDRRVAIGTLGRLRLRLAGEEYVEDVEIVWCRIAEHAATVFHVGLRFLWTRPRHARSIRHAVDGGIADLFAIPETTRVM